MPSAHYSSFDRGFDVGQRSAPKIARAEHDRSGLFTTPKKSPTRKYVAIALVAVMVVSAFAMIVPGGPKGTQAPEDKLPASSEQAGPMEVQYTISDIGAVYNKSTNYNLLGKHTSPGLSDYWFARGPIGGYGDTIVRNTYPYVIAYPPYAGAIGWGGDAPLLSFIVNSFYKLSIDAKNVTGLGTGPGGTTAKDVNVLPLLSGDPTLYGGNATMNMHFTYLTTNEESDIENGTHYANSYYGVPPVPQKGSVKWGGINYEDGWWMEGQGTVVLDRPAMKKYLNLDTTQANMSVEFEATNSPSKQTPNVLGDAWASEWTAEAGTGDIYDITACYDWPIDSGMVYCHLKLDVAHSGDDQITILLYSVVWGSEFLYMRYFDVAGIAHNMEPNPDDWYWNVTLNPEYGDFESKMVAAYHMTAWRDMAAFTPSWMIEAQHVDYTSLGYVPPSPTWDSQYDPYWWYFDFGEGPDLNYMPLRYTWSPGQSTYGTEVAYWYSPQYWNLAEGEVLKFKLPMTSVGWGVTPYSDAVDDLNAAKVTQLNSHGMTGEWVLGHGYPSDYYSPTYYDSATKTLTFTGPLDMGLNADAAYPTIPETGTPQILVDISKVSHYALSIQASPPYSPGTPYTLRVTPQDLALAGVTGWNGTCNLEIASGNAVLGASSLTFAGEAYKETTITFSDMNGATIKSSDSVFSLDVFDTLTVPPGDFIPEFPTLLIPVIGAAAVFVILRRRKTSV